MRGGDPKICSAEYKIVHLGNSKSRSRYPLPTTPPHTHTHTSKEAPDRPLKLKPMMIDSNLDSK